MSKIILAPIGIVAGLLAGQLAKTLFDFVWSRVSDEEAPRPDHHRVTWPRLVAALIIEGAIFRLVKGIVDRETRAGFGSPAPGRARNGPSRPSANGPLASLGSVSGVVVGAALITVVQEVVRRIEEDTAITSLTRSRSF